MALWLCRHIYLPEGTTGRWSAQGWLAGPVLACAGLCWPGRVVVGVGAGSVVRALAWRWWPLGGGCASGLGVLYARTRPRALFILHPWIVEFFKVKNYRTPKFFKKFTEKFYKYVQPTVPEK